MTQENADSEQVEQQQNQGGGENVDVGNQDNIDNTNVRNQDNVENQDGENNSEDDVPIHPDCLVPDDKSVLRPCVVLIPPSPQTQNAARVQSIRSGDKLWITAFDVFVYDPRFADRTVVLDSIPCIILKFPENQSNIQPDIQAQNQNLQSQIRSSTMEVIYGQSLSQLQTAADLAKSMNRNKFKIKFDKEKYSGYTWISRARAHQQAQRATNEQIFKDAMAAIPTSILEQIPEIKDFDELETFMIQRFPGIIDPTKIKNALEKIIIPKGKASKFYLWLSDKIFIYNHERAKLRKQNQDPDFILPPLNPSIVKRSIYIALHAYDPTLGTAF